ncbi:NUDIX hydrolase [Hyphomonas johnsonii]|jgi:8-oxo-dGTP pyrophosphatase MutT (NUDIX family)|uniref:NUDIX family hydrolase n=1 Tax=Hyphomonas johnsonii MHS-2 TaxID=1280950 RepID=A0A059FUE0_9PROT|nr:NUDIX domain-containing protein [Hyphomonas johnsonii]KCZ94033.1 NUDIX family hydrolase [Hyphomonas johnsonii MHS-2]
MNKHLPGLKSAFDTEDDGDVVLTGEPSPRPKDAATLILVRRDGPEPRVLLGKRSGRHSFMPEKYVFPGGRVDPQDARAPTLTPLSDPVATKLAIGTRRAPHAFALTAIRETFEETGLIVGRPGQAKGKPPAGWDRYYSEGVMPSLRAFQFIGRAVTPPFRPKRFDARFFMADAQDALIDERPPVDGAELSDLQWVTLTDSLDLDLPSVTRFMLGEIGERLARPGTPHGPPFLRWTRNGHSLDRL